MLPGWNSQRMTNHTFDKIVADLKPARPRKDDNGDPSYRIHLAVRCDAEVSDGPALEFGIWSNGREQMRRSVDVSEIRGKDYQWIKTRPIQLQPGADLWLSPPNRPGEVDAVYIDRIIVVREN